MPYNFPPWKVRAARLTEGMAWLVHALLGGGPRPRVPLDEVRSVLLVEPFQFGDVISLSTILQPLRDLLPGARITLLTQPSCAMILQGDPRVDHIIGVPFPWVRGNNRSWRGWLSCWRAIRALRRSGGYDLGIDTRGELRTHVVLRLAGCRRRAGYTNYLGSNMRIRGLLLTDNAGDLPVMHRGLINREIIARVFHTQLPPLQFPLLLFPGQPPMYLHPGKRQIVVHPGAGAPHRQWEPRKWAEVLRHLQSHHDVGVVLVGGPGDQSILEAIHAQGAAAHITRITSLAELAGLLKAADLFVGMDSGPMNLAASLGIPVVAIFGPSDHQGWYPLSPRSRWITKFDASACDPALTSRAGDPPHPSLQAISSAEVIDLIEQTLQELSAASSRGSNAS